MLQKVNGTRSTTGVKQDQCMPKSLALRMLWKSVVYFDLGLGAVAPKTLVEHAFLKNIGLCQFIQCNLFIDGSLSVP